MNSILRSVVPLAMFNRLDTQGYFLYELGMDLLVESLRQRLDKVAR